MFPAKQPCNFWRFAPRIRVRTIVGDVAVALDVRGDRSSVHRRFFLVLAQFAAGDPQELAARSSGDCVPAALPGVASLHEVVAQNHIAVDGEIVHENVRVHSRLVVVVAEFTPRANILRRGEGGIGVRGAGVY